MLDTLQPTSSFPAREAGESYIAIRVLSCRSAEEEEEYHGGKKRRSVSNSHFARSRVCAMMVGKGLLSSTLTLSVARILNAIRGASYRHSHLANLAVVLNPLAEIKKFDEAVNRLSRPPYDKTKVAILEAFAKNIAKAMVDAR